MIPYINDIGLSADEIDRVEELHNRFAFVVYNAGFSCTMEEDRKVEMCYWQNLRGVRQSALFPGHAAAWRDALRVHDEAVDAVKANPGVTRVPRMPADESAELSRLKRHAEAQGYTFGKGRVGQGQVWKFNGMTEGGHDTHAKAIRGAIKHWARRDPEAFCKAMNLLGEGGEPMLTTGEDGKLETSFTVGARNLLPPLSSAELAELQGLPGYDEMPEEHKQLTAQTQQMIKLMQLKGVTFDLSKLITPVYKSQGKSFEEVEEDQLRAKRAYGVPQGSLEEGQLRTLECVGYKFVFTSTWGWQCEQVPYVKGALVNCIKEAWQHAIAASNDEEGMLATAKAYMEGSNEWQGIGQPPPGTVLWITPHNTLWGFNVVDVYLCEVMMYDGEHVWLKVLSDLGHDIGQYATTRIDKVDVKVWKGNKDA